MTEEELKAKELQEAAEAAAAAEQLKANKPAKEKSKGLTTEQQSTLKRLQALPKKTIFIPEDPQNPDDLVVPVCVNGVTYSIPRGKKFEVPDVIADIWEESYTKTQAANRRIKVQQDLDIKITS
ncbi:MAG: hypothetical protein ACE3L7_25560 [Candidatus Pristimantibacillus sp.]